MSTTFAVEPQQSFGECCDSPAAPGSSAFPCDMSNRDYEINEQLIYTLEFGQITLKDLSRGGGKNASLGELFNSLKPKGVGVLDG